jgi:hypothetical protein
MRNYMTKIKRCEDVETAGQVKAEVPEEGEGPVLEGPLPPEIAEHVRRCLVGLGLHNWMVDTWRYDQIEPDRPSLTGRSQIRPRYRVALLQLRAEGGKHRRSHEHVITHEALHIALGPVYNALNRIVELVPKKLRDHAYAIYEDSEEPVIETLASALTPLLLSADPGAGEWRYDEEEGVLVPAKKRVHKGT